MRTRYALILAAREMFERQGYIGTSVVDVAKEAGVTTASFYTYFDNKEEILAEIIAAVQEDMLHPGLSSDRGTHSVIEIIAAANREYLLAYRSNAKIMSVFEQVAQVHDTFREMRRIRGVAFNQRNARLIRRLQEQGDADPDLDPVIAAWALSAMVARMAYQVFVLKEPMAFDDLLQTVNRLWVNGLQLKHDAQLLPISINDDVTILHQ